MREEEQPHTKKKHPSWKWIAGVLIISFIFCFIWGLLAIKQHQEEKRASYQKVASQPTKNIRPTLYQNNQLGYAFSYPSSMVCKESPNLCFLTKKSDTSSQPSWIQVEALDNGYKNADTFEKNIINYASLMCDADGPTGSIRCPKALITLQKFINEHKIEGYIAHRTIQMTSYQTQEPSPTVTKQKDSILFYRLDHAEYFAVAFSRSWGGSSSDGELFSIANTYHYLK